MRKWRVHSCREAWSIVAFGTILASRKIEFHALAIEDGAKSPCLLLFVVQQSLGNEN